MFHSIMKSLLSKLYCVYIIYPTERTPSHHHHYCTENVAATTESELYNSSEKWKQNYEFETNELPNGKKLTFAT